VLGTITGERFRFTESRTQTDVVHSPNVLSYEFSDLPAPAGVAIGAFTSGQSLASSSNLGVALGDLDGDGDLDAYVVNSSEANRVWLNDGAGTFTDNGQGGGPVTFPASLSWAVSLGDLDNDGDLDAFVGMNGPNRVWLNNGAGIFTDSGQRLGLFVGLSGNSRAVSLGDLDRDGDLDAFVANDDENRVWLNEDVALTVTAKADLGGTGKYLSLRANGKLFDQKLFKTDGAQLETVTNVLALTQAHLSTLESNGTASFTLTPSDQVTNLGTSELTVELSYWAATDAEDWYRFTLADRESASIALSARTPGDVTLELYDSNANLLAVGVSSANVDQIISNFVHTTSNRARDTYFVRVSGGNLEYSLVVMRNADFDTEPNDGLLSNAQDITKSGTVRVKDIRVEGFGSSPRYLTNVGGTLYFTADDSTSGDELWKSDGTEAGTIRIKDIRAGSSPSYPRYLTNVGGTLYFRADDGTSGDELWKSDGSEPGTVLGHVGTEGDVDHYSVDATSGDMLTVEAVIPASGPGGFVNNLDLGIELYDPSGTRVAGPAIGSLMHRATQTGTYTARMFSEGGVSGGRVRAERDWPSRGTATFSSGCGGGPRRNGAFNSANAVDR
jgi:ELWxxDGT repeat protein